MRRITFTAVACCLAVALAGAQDSRHFAPSTNVLTRYLDRADIHPPVQVGRLTVFPIVLSRTNPIDRVLTMDQALAKKLLVIEELKNAQVSRARFVNKSGDRMIFLMAGEVVTGGKQNRTLTTDALLGPDSAVVLPLYCVQKGRWRGGVGFTKTTTIVPQAIRARAIGKAGQQEIWAEVSRANRRLGSSTVSDDLAAAMTKPENVKRLSGLRRKILPRLPKGTAGVVIARGSRIVGADLFNSAELFSAMQDKVLNSYLSQYFQEASGVSRVPIPSQDAVRRYLQSCYRARFTPSDTRGVGKIYELSGARTGQTLAYQRIGPRPHKGGRSVIGYGFMVHTALMEKIVPVKPVPIRPPIPMPRPMPEPRPRPSPRR